MYVRGAKKREEVWLLDRLDELGLDDPAFRSRDYVVALDEETGDKVGFGRLRTHRGDPEVCELTAIGVLPAFQEQGVAAHVVERLVELAGDQGFDRVFVLTDEGGYLTQFGFHRVSEDDLPPQLQTRLVEMREDRPDVVPFVIGADDFEMPPRLRRRFKEAGPESDEEEQEDPEDFGIDPDSATYKYDTGG